MMTALTMFTWGYWGWGTHTDQLIRAVDAVETSRGFQPPLFVDIRLSRSVRAPGFRDAAFENALGKSRYRWLDSLGNLAVRDGGAMRIKDPAAAGTLLNIAEAASRSRRRVLLFCACEWPGTDAEPLCHRTVVARLVLQAARSRKWPVHIIEWPGGEPEYGMDISLPKAAFEKIARGATTIPLAKPKALAEMAGLPWLSAITVHNKDSKEQSPLRLLGSPARYGKNGWCIPIFDDIPEHVSDRQLVKHIQTLRKRHGFVDRYLHRMRPPT